MVAVLVPIADDSEEIETSCLTDVLVRAGIEVTVASVMPDGRLQCKMARGLKVVADLPIAACVGREWDAIALPGGMPGAKHLSECQPLIELLKAHMEAKKTTGAICAAPAMVLAAHGLLPPTATSFPADAMKAKVSDAGATWTDSRVVVDGHVITSQGPGTALQFALTLVERLVSAAKAEEVAAALLTHM